MVGTLDLLWHFQLPCNFGFVAQDGSGSWEAELWSRNDWVQDLTLPFLPVSEPGWVIWSLIASVALCKMKKTKSLMS